MVTTATDTGMKITWRGPVKLSRTEYYLGYLGRLEVARLDSNDIRSHWKLKLKVPGYVTDAPGGVRYSDLEDGQQAAEEILVRWMQDVGMAWAPLPSQVRTWTRYGVQYDGVTEGEVRQYKNTDLAAAALAEDKYGLFKNGRVARQQIDEIWHDWEPIDD